jgi:uncharacterized membrane protein YccC
MILRTYVNWLHDPKGFQYGSQIFLGTCGLWFLTRILGGIDPLWAIISLIVVTEANTETTWFGFKSRIINTIVGCLTGLLFLLFIKTGGMVLPLALATAVCVSAYLIRIPYGWRAAAITAAIIVIPALTEGSKTVGMVVAFQRTMEVFLGSAMALFVAWLFTILKGTRRQS